MKKSKVAMRIYLGIILALSFTFDGLAQNAAEFRIQEEKNNPENIWVEEISGNEEEARERAKQKLVVNNLRDELRLKVENYLYSMNIRFRALFWTASLNPAYRNRKKTSGVITVIC